jgi:hypothetical protein
LRERRVVVDAEDLKGVIESDPTFQDRSSVERTQQTLANRTHFDPPCRVSPGDDDPAAIDDD